MKHQGKNKIKFIKEKKKTKTPTNPEAEKRRHM